MPELSQQDREYIRENWAALSCRQLGKELHCNPTTVMRTGQRMGLGRKPHPRQVSEGQAQRKRENVPTDKNSPTFFDMVTSVFAQLVSERNTLLERLQQLAKLPSDDRGRVALEVGSTTDKLNKIEASLIDAEELAEASQKYRPKKPSPADELTTFDELFDHLNTPEARKEEGRITGKVKIAAQRVAEDWQHNLFTYEDGSVDVVMLTPESVMKAGE